MNRLPGISGTLFPERFVAERLVSKRPGDAMIRGERARLQFVRWWASVERAAGPASGLYALFDLVAMPLAGRAGFRARAATFSADHANATLVTPSGRTVGLALLPWAERRPVVWRDLIVFAEDIGATWCLLVAPPFVSIVEARGHATRRSVDFRLPDALAPESFPAFHALVHARTFEPIGTDGPAWLDDAVRAAAAFQAGVRADLERGVHAAVRALRGVLTRSPNANAEALTLVYRILFLLFAESRALVPRGHPVYARAYSVAALCRDAASDERRGLWDGLAAVTRLSRTGCQVDQLIVRPFNGHLFARQAAPALEARRFRRRAANARARDEAMARALVALGSRSGRAGREDISYADLGVEQLGSVYETLLDLDDRETGGAHGRRRKETGTFYTPQPLAEFVVRRTLAPLVSGRSADAILALRVLDPAMGSGAFLVAACRYLADAYEHALVEEGRTTPLDMDEAARADVRRLVAERCLAGVDRNPVAVELARLSLWLTTLAHGKPLTFLDHRLRAGNSLIGASPHDLRRTPRLSSRSPPGLPLFEEDALHFAVRDAVGGMTFLTAHPDDTLADVHLKESTWRRLAGGQSPTRSWRLALDAWCARWFQKRPTSPPELRAVVDAILKGDRTLPTGELGRRLTDASDTAAAHAFFHWPLEFPEIFHDETGRRRADAGFDAVIGNPPWEMLRGRERSNETPGTHGPAGREDAAFVRFVRESGIYGSCAHGHLNLYQPFVERAIALTRPAGRVGLVLPWGVATDDGAAALRRLLVGPGGLQTVVGLDNARALFPIHRGMRFAVVVAAPGRPTGEIRARFGVRSNDELNALPAMEDAAAPTAYPVRFSPSQLAAVGGASLRIPDARDPGDFAWLERMMRTYRPAGADDGWRLRVGRELNATEDSRHFGLSGLPVVEGKHLEPFHVQRHAAAHRLDPAMAARLLPGGEFRRARLGYRDVSAATNKWSLIAAVLPPRVVTTHTVFVVKNDLGEETMHALAGLFNSYVLNAIVRMLMGSHVTTSLVEALPLPSPDDGRLRELASLARAAAEHDETGDRHAARLQALAAAIYGLSAVEFKGLVEKFSLVPAEERRAAAEAFGAVSQGGAG